MNSTARKIIETLNLQPLDIEGGYFCRTYTANETNNFTFPSGIEKRPVCSAIYYLLTPDTHSKIHRLPTDEIYHFYLGDPVELLLLENNGMAKTINLHNDILHNGQPQFAVPEHTWQGSRLKPRGEFALLGTTMAPAFEYADFQTPEDLDSLLEAYPPAFHELIKALF